MYMSLIPSVTVITIFRRQCYICFLKQYITVEYSRLLSVRLNIPPKNCHKDQSIYKQITILTSTGKWQQCFYSYEWSDYMQVTVLYFLCNISSYTYVRRNWLDFMSCPYIMRAVSWSALQFEAYSVRAGMCMHAFIFPSSTSF
jgi:hypothetical protein